MKFFRDIGAIVWKDIVSELRTKEIFTSMFVFALLVIIIFNFAFDLSKVRPMDVGHGILWVAFTFSGILGLNRSFLYEKENDCIQGLLLSPTDRGAIYLGKMIGNLIFILIMEMLILPFFIIFFNISIGGNFLQLLLIIVLCSIGFIAVGTLFSAMSASIKTREIMLPILLFPIVVPIIIAAVKSTGAIFANKPIETFMHWIKLIIAFDIIFLTVSFVTFEYVIEE